MDKLFLKEFHVVFDLFYPRSTCFGVICVGLRNVVEPESCRSNLCETLLEQSDLLFFLPLHLLVVIRVDAQRVNVFLDLMCMVLTKGTSHVISNNLPCTLACILSLGS